MILKQELRIYMYTLNIYHVWHYRVLKIHLNKVSIYQVPWFCTCIWVPFQKEIQNFLHLQTPLFRALVFPVLELNLQELAVDGSNNEPVNVRFPPPTVDSKNKSVPGASTKVELRFDEKWGNHLVAAKNIQPGEGNYFVQV